MHYVIDAAHRLTQALGVTHVADEITHARCIERLLHFVLLELVAENTTTRLGWYCSSKRRMKLRPNEPVPPEMKIDCPLNML